jgi:hypothetical protein
VNINVHRENYMSHTHALHTRYKRDALPRPTEIKSQRQGAILLAKKREMRSRAPAASAATETTATNTLNPNGAQRESPPQNKLQSAVSSKSAGKDAKKGKGSITVTPGPHRLTLNLGFPIFSLAFAPHKPLLFVGGGGVYPWPC